MSWFTRMFSDGSSSLIENIADVADRFITTDAERNAFKLQVEQLLQQRDSALAQTIRAELSAKERILVAELTQGDSYTKRARPTVVYAGLSFIGINYVLIPLIARAASIFGVAGIDPRPLTDLPTEFWAAWGGICAAWVMGRSVEKRGSRNSAVKVITGNPTTTRLLD